MLFPSILLYPLSPPSILLSFFSRVPTAHIFNENEINNPSKGKLGISQCPGLLNRRPSRAESAPQRSLKTDIKSLKEYHGVTDIFIIACDWELPHYNGISHKEYCNELHKLGITVHMYQVQEAKAPILQVSIVNCSSIFFVSRALIYILLIFKRFVFFQTLCCLKKMCLIIHSDLKKCLSQGKTVVMHSKKSLGRAPTVLTTYLLRCHPELIPDIAIEHVRRCCGRGAIQTVKQYNHCHEFHEHQQQQITQKETHSSISSPVPFHH